MGAKNSEYLITKITDAEANKGYKKALEQRKKKSAKKKKTLGRGIVKEITVKFRSQRDAIKFAEEIHQTISIKDKKLTFDSSKRGKGKFVGEPSGKNGDYGLSDFHQTHWVGMPEFEQEDSKWEWHRLKVAFKNWDDYKKFAHIVRQFLKRTTSSIYFPEWTAAELKGRAWKSSLPRSKKNPRYPIYIVSKGRSYSRLTSKALEGLGVPYYIVVEPQDYDEYVAVIDSKKVLKLPEDTDPENPTGPGRARNFCRDHSWMNGHPRHFVMDDNIEGFYRLHKNRRYKVGDGTIFRAAEDFVDRYKNVLVAGFQYRFFCAAKSKYPPFVKNTRIYSCLLIDNSKLFKWKNGKRKRVNEKPIVVNAPKGKPMSSGMFLWRERYNEDTILSLDALENGYATIQFNAFLQGKTGTQKLAGGNSDLFYLSEEVNEEEQDNDGNYKNAGTVRKSLILEKAYPEVAKVVWKFNRPHHEVNYTKYERIPLVLKSGQPKRKGVNDYGMRLVSVESAKESNIDSTYKIKVSKRESIFTKANAASFNEFVNQWRAVTKLPNNAGNVFSNALQYHDKKRASQAKEMALIERRWYQSLKRGKPDYSVYGLPYYYVDLWVCWCRYSRRYLKEIQAPKSLFGNSIVSAIKANTVVDLGCGFGYTTAALKEIFPKASVIGTNLKGTSQYYVSEALGKERNFSVSASIPKADLLFASEYFEHHLEPIKHLQEVLNRATPKYMLIANAFGTRAIGHFEHYLHDGKRVSAKEMARLFSAALKSFGWKKVKTACWNNRPQFWMKF